MKTSGRTIPIAVIGATVFAAIFYVFIAIVSAGVLPLDEVMNQPLSVQAKHVMPASMYLYFAIGVGIISLLGIINVQFMWE